MLIFSRELSISWIAGPTGIDEPLLGIWPGLPGRPRAQIHRLTW
ncbi:hypothetical protein AB0I53_33740 [Saccharopolyspora sp. NPDC050389]